MKYNYLLICWGLVRISAYEFWKSTIQLITSIKITFDSFKEMLLLLFSFQLIPSYNYPCKWSGLMLSWVQTKNITNTERTFCCIQSDNGFFLLKCAIAIIKVIQQKSLLFIFNINNQLGNGMGKIKSIHSNKLQYIYINLRRNVEGTQKYEIL